MNVSGHLSESGSDRPPGTMNLDETMSRVARLFPESAPPVAVRYVRNERARHYVIRIDARGGVRVTIPRGGSRASAERWVAGKQRWILDHLKRIRPILPWGPGTLVWFRGEQRDLRADNGMVRLDELTIPVPAPPEDWRPAIQAQLRRCAELELPPLVHHAARCHALPLRRISIRNQRTRWGSCSRRGTISLNWRLIQTPRLVRDYLIAHELAHLREMNHSRSFWRVVEQLFPAWRDAEAWLRQHGRELLP